MLKTFPSIWTSRLHFGVLLLIFNELVTWQSASTYTIFDWLALLLIYTALGAAALDLIVRYRAIESKSLLLVAGLVATTRSAMILPISIHSDHFVVLLVFLTLGAGVLMFLLAWLSFRLLASGEATGMWAFLLAGGVGLGWGIWARWFAELDIVAVRHPDVADTLPIVLAALVIVSLLPRFLHPPTEMQTLDWLLMPYEWAGTGGVLLITLILRSDQGYLEGIGAGILLMLLVMLGFMLAFTGNMRRGTPLRLITPPRQPLFIGWLIILIPFTLMAWLAYSLSDTRHEPFQATLLFRAILIFGAAWLPVASTILGVSIMSRLTREGY